MIKPTIFENDFDAADHIFEIRKRPVTEEQFARLAEVANWPSLSDINARARKLSTSDHICPICAQGYVDQRCDECGVSDMRGTHGS